MYVRVMRVGAVEAVAGLRAAFDAFAACDVGALTRAELLSVLDDYEALTCQMPGPLHRLLAQLQAETTPRSWVPNRGTRCCGSGGGCRLLRPVVAWPRRRCWGRGVP